MIRLTGHKSAVLGLAFSPDGQRFASASADATVRLWDIGSGTEVNKLFAPYPQALCVAFSPDGRQLASGYEGGGLQLWDYGRFVTPERSVPHARHCAGLAFSKDSRWLYSIGPAKVCRQPTSGSAKTDYYHPGELEAFDLDDEGRPVVLLTSGKVDRLDEKLERATTLIAGYLHCQRGLLRCRPGSNDVVLTSGRFFGYWSGTPRELPRTILAHADDLRGLAFLPDGNSLLTAGLDGLVKRWDVQSLAEWGTYDFGVGECFSLAVSADGMMAAVGGLTDIAVWDLL